MSGYLKNIAAMVAAISAEKKKQFIAITVGWSFWGIWNWWYDNALFLGVIAGKGIIDGGLIMLIATLIHNFVWLVVYKFGKMKWVGDTSIEKMFKWTKKVYTHKYKYTIAKMLAYTLFLIPRILLPVVLWCIAKGGVKAFVALSCFTDSFVTTAYLRKDAESRLGLKSITLFVASTIVSCVYWTLRSWGLVTVLLFVREIIRA